ncbi:MAG TPA: DUF5677 domain-containing protein [Cyclobacteriaceae bacterium]|nr:hypothetical protein [Cyclobacteriaceae bacterium]HMX88010.1 DUF5677 domain-containing protein [Saprospiraceae bacterium]HMX00844.1 DUF5677 domain-containing protein [Cyclobacteriaceae bacterium]HMY93648.1 DUF5677 domain-containing protein [Cyclobacteriaceae bacterium]HNA12918.1 DUF5677 domain-containing protein [Cyclobacteriaceae bacterium]
MDALVEHPIRKLEELLLLHLIKVYEARKTSKREGLDKYSDLLIDKFAIHAGTLFHLLNGLIEAKGSSENAKKMAIDVFTINSLLRVLMETYVTFHHLFVHPQNPDEKEFKLLLWKLEGHFEKKKFRILEGDFQDAASVLNEDDIEIASIAATIENHLFRSELTSSEFSRIFGLKEKKAVWRFLHKNGRARILKIIDLVEYTCPTRAFFNLYRYASMHTHSGYVSIEHFEKMRGQLLSDSYINNFPRMAAVLTIFLIVDLATIDVNARKAFDDFSEVDKRDFNGIHHSFRTAAASDPKNTFAAWRSL